MEECKVMKDYSANYATQRPHNEREARSGGYKKRCKTIKFDGTTEEVNITTAHDAPIPRKNRGGGQVQNPKSDKDTAVTKEKELIYVIDRLNLGDPAFKLENDSKWLLAGRPDVKQKI